MSFLNLRKKNTEPKEAPKKETVVKKLAVAEATKSVKGEGVGYSNAIIRAHITEKASASAEKGIYVFEVATNANKREIAKAVSAFYKVTPIKVTVVTIPKKRIVVKGKLGVRAGGKKAYVFLKKGEKIELV